MKVSKDFHHFGSFNNANVIHIFKIPASKMALVFLWLKLEIRNAAQAGQVKDADNMDKGSSPDITELKLADPEDMVMETKMQTEGSSYTCSFDF